MSKQLLEIKKDLQRCLSKERYASAIDILSQLYSFAVTAKLLKETEVGKYLSTLKKHSHKPIAEKASETIEKWKEDVEKQKKPIERSISLDAVDYDSLGNDTRDKCVGMIYTSLATDNEFDGIQVLAKSKEIELLLFKESGSVDAKYKNRIRSYYLNLKDKRNPSLRINVIQGKISVARLCSMSAADLASAELKAEIRALQNENLFKAQGATNTSSETDQFKCGKCKGRKTTYHQMQTRSADEPMTTFVTCLICDNHWKFS